MSKKIRDNFDKARKTEINKRIHICVKLLNDGLNVYQISQIMTKVGDKRRRGEKLTEEEEKMDWNVNERQVYEYADKAIKIIEEFALQNSLTNYKQALHRYNKIYNLAMKKNNLAAALKAQERIDFLTALGSYIEKYGAPGDKQTGDSPDQAGSVFILPDGTKLRI